MMRMEKNTPEEFAKHIIAFYNEYDLRISGKINNQTAYQLIEEIEKKFQPDTIALPDGTKIWNLLRVFLYSNFQKLGGEVGQKKLNKNSFKSFFSLFKESLMPLHLPKNITFCGFSSVESRKLYNDTYYDIYLDPLYDILGDRLAVFEWPESTGYRRKYDHPVYSRKYIQMHIPLYTKTFWRLLFYQLTNHRNYTLQSEEVLKDIIRFICSAASVDENKLTKDIYDFITVFAFIKEYLYDILNKIKPKAVLIRCGYGRFPMALSQACRELGIRSIELQHGMIDDYLPAYRKTMPSNNKDCVPEYLLTHGDIFTDLVRDGNLFDPQKVVSAGFPYMERHLKERKKIDSHQKKMLTPFPHNILITSQWIIASEIENFVIKVAEEFEKAHMDIGILFKPHPYDKKDYSQLQKVRRIILIDKYEDIFKLFTTVDIHSTVFSTSGLEAMAFGVPNIFIDAYNISHFTIAPYIITSPAQFIESVGSILSHYNDSVDETKALAHLFFAPSPEKNFRNFFTELGLL